MRMENYFGNNVGGNLIGILFIIFSKHSPLNTCQQQLIEAFVLGTPSECGDDICPTDIISSVFPYASFCFNIPEDVQR